MKLLAELQKQVSGMGKLRHAWFTSFNADIEFVETYILPATIGANPPRNRLEYEQLQQELTTNAIDFRVFCDPRFIETNRVKRTCIPVHGVRPMRTADYFSDTSLFHPKVVYLEDVNGKRVIGAGSANLTVSGWGRNLEVFTFNDVTTYKNYRKIRDFFARLCDAAGISCTLQERPGFKGKTENWRFVHSYQNDTFPKQLLGDAIDTDLAVWSPYLPRDLAGFIDNLHTAASAKNLDIHLVPDRVNGKYLRTEWSEDLARMLEDGRLTAYDNPAPRHQKTDLCHAKIWKLPGKLAIGSWNFTGPGSNSLRDEDGNWSLDNNVEAGFIIEDRHNWQDACGKQLVLDAGDCASPTMLDEEGLTVDPLPPFDLHVRFDWREHGYSFDGRWLGDGTQDGYSVRLPGVDERVRLEWNAQCDPKQPGVLVIDDLALLRDRVYIVYRGDQEVYSALVQEMNVRSRRAQAFETLQALIDAFVQNDDPRSLHDLPFRAPLDNDPLAVPATVAAEVDAVSGSVTPGLGGISYFRLFHAMHVYHEKLSKLEKLEELDNHVFSWPGCLLELLDKTRDEVRKPGREVFNWFLANEARSLCEHAQARRRSLIRGANEREGGYTPIPKSRWRTLCIDLPAAPSGVHEKYVTHVRKQCSYE
ncbi:phospholipase D family protein [Massilia niastensis]|uniref:phospholipase D family protein n=1 Tax=Massilia niastensis TaxID=544911 RepID=UPI000367ED44|nr:phospholipase D family protein [Massilia niastensis]